MMVYFIVPGDPKGKERPRVSGFKTGHAFIYTPDQTVQYQKLVREQYETMAQGFRFDDDEELVVIISANFKIPKSASKKKAQMMLDGLVKPTKTPDCDNIAKIVLDALNGCAYKDDSRVVRLNVEKFYANEPYVAVFIASKTEYEAYNLPEEAQDGRMD